MAISSHDTTRKHAVTSSDPVCATAIAVKTPPYPRCHPFLASPDIPSLFIRKNLEPHDVSRPLSYKIMLCFLKNPRKEERTRDQRCILKRSCNTDTHEELIVKEVQHT